MRTIGTSCEKKKVWMVKVFVHGSADTLAEREEIKRNKENRNSKGTR